MVSNRDINSIRSSNHFFMSGWKHNFVHCLYRIEKHIYIYTYIYHIYVYPQHDRSLTAPSYREKCCHFPPVSELLEGWEQHFCCYTLALQRILAVWKKTTKNTRVELGFFGCFFSPLSMGGVVGRRYQGRSMFVWMGTLCMYKK